MPVVGLTSFLALKRRARSGQNIMALWIFLLAWVVQPAASQVLSYAHIDEMQLSRGSLASQIDADFTLYWSLADINQQMRSGKAVDLLLVSGSASWLSAYSAAAQGILADKILFVATDMGAGSSTPTLGLPKEFRDLAAGPVTEKNIQVRLVRLPSDADRRLSEAVRTINGLANGPLNALAFVCSRDPLKDPPRALAKELAPRNWEVLYIFQNCLALWHGMPDSIANEKRNHLPLQERKAPGYRIVTLAVDGSSFVTERSRPGEATETVKSARKLGDLMLAETLEQHWQLRESEAKYESALASTDEAVLRRAANGLDRVLWWRAACRWFSRLMWVVIIILLLLIARQLFRVAGLRLLGRRGRMVLRVESLADSEAIPNFAMRLNRQEQVLTQLVGESLWADGGATRMFAPPPSQALNLGTLPSLSVSKVDVKSVLVWAQTFIEYFSARRLVVWVGELSHRITVRGSIESGWTNQGDCTFEADTEDEAAWQVVTWAAGHDVSQ